MNAFCGQLRNSALWIFSVANNKFVPEVIAEIFYAQFKISVNLRSLFAARGG